MEEKFRTCASIWFRQDVSLLRGLVNKFRISGNVGETFCASYILRNSLLAVLDLLLLVYSFVFCPFITDIALIFVRRYGLHIGYEVLSLKISPKEITFNLKYDFFQV